MICKEAIFVHIPKTAGQSIEQALREHSGLRWDGRNDLVKRRDLLLKENKKLDSGPPRLAHLKASEYVTCGFVPPEQFDACFKFSFVRNPWDRIISEYKFRKHFWEFDFKSYLFKHFPEKDGTDFYVHIIPQYNFLFDAKGQCLVNFIGRFENLQVDFNKVCRELAIQEIIVPHKNNSLSNRPRILNLKKFTRWTKNLRKQRANTFAHYTEYYDDEAIEFVRDKYRKDIEVFKYEFGET
jgi:hypothetical protein